MKCGLLQLRSTKDIYTVFGKYQQTKREKDCLIMRRRPAAQVVCRTVLDSSDM